MYISPHFSPHFSIWYSSPRDCRPALDLTEALIHSVKSIPFTQVSSASYFEQIYAPGPLLFCHPFIFIHIFTKSPAIPCIVLPSPFPFVIKTLLATQLTVFHLHQHTESTCKENIEREKSKERPADTFLRKDRNTPKELLRVSRCPE